MGVRFIGGVLAAAVTLTVSTGQAQRGPAPQAQPPLVRENATEKISDHVYVIPDNNVGMVPNVGIIVGTRGTLVVDTGLGARNGQTIVREMRKVSKTPELYLASTHVHPEHDLGAGGFPPETKMIRSQAQIKEIAESGLETAKRFSGFSPLNAELLAGAEFRKADITFDQEHRLDLGGVRVRVIAVGYNHTRGDQAFFVEPDGILFSGDVSMMALPNVGGATVTQWIASQDLFAKLQPKRVVPSHGAMGDLSMIANNRAFLQTVQGRVAELKKQGRTLEETTATVTAELTPKYPAAGGRLTGAIRAAYSEAP
jgi:glyoxylase-like metal-dependent hydrolase (beta-lactamase superfamily II)